MTFYAALYTLLVGPIQLLFEAIFLFADRVFLNPGFSIIAMSLTMNFLILPMSVMIDSIQAESFQKEKKLEPVVSHIKKTFSGDEQYMMLLTYYRQQNYKPTDALKGSISLLLEIPFFIAAYNFLSNLSLLNGAAFGPLTDLGSPDKLLVIGGITINILPIIMTIINLISCSIYSSTITSKSKFQLYIISGIFLVLLYNSPSGLVFYWTLNNLFSLIKNICFKTINKEILKWSMYIILFLTGFTMLAKELIINPSTNYNMMDIKINFSCIIMLPLFLKVLSEKYFGSSDTSQDRTTFILSGLVLTLLIGLLIPSSVLYSSPEDFINILQPVNPIIYVISSLLLAAGTFLIWGNVFYSIAKDNFRKLMNYGIWIFCVIALIDYIGFGMLEGTLSPQLAWIDNIDYEESVLLANVSAVIGAIIIFTAIYKKFRKQVKLVCLAVCLAITYMSATNLFSAQTIISESKCLNLSDSKDQLLSVPLSKTGKNVVILMMDRAINSYIPYIFKEKPELKKQFAGFTIYTNTISHGFVTNIGGPALYGGYEYTPKHMNLRDKELLEDKHNGALRVMPVLFDEAGFKVTVSDPSLAGYHIIPDLSIYNDHPNIRTFITANRYTRKTNLKNEDRILRRNFFCYSLSQAAPMQFRKLIYGGGSYCDPETDCYSPQVYYDNNKRAHGMGMEFMSSYEVMDDLPLLTKIEDKNENTFFMMANYLTHAPAMLQLPNYVPALSIDNRAYLKKASNDYYNINGRILKMDNLNQINHYHVNVCAYLTLGKWFDYLRSQGVYDNTRIILVSDHGQELNQLDDMIFGDLDIMGCHSILLVKDFNSKELTFDNRFMTNADCPTIAMKGIIDKPVNPQTGKEITDADKYKEEQFILYSYNSNLRENCGYKFKRGKWYSVKDNIFNKSNWKDLSKQ